MKSRSTVLTCLASIAMLALGSPVASAAQTPKAKDSVANVGARTAAQLEQAQMSRAFTNKWGAYVQRVYGVNANVWSQRMGPSLAIADASNLRNALKRNTFEGAMAEVGGVGAKLSDNKVINILAASKGSNPTPQALGALINDLVYTPVQPCRILDTRIAGGVIASNGSRSFVALTNSGSFEQQGGSVSDCGTQGFAATAVAVNLTAVTPAAAGFATAYPFGTTRPLAASINYAAGAIVNNALIIQIPNPLSSSDFTLYTLGQSHFVADIVGYFAPPVATALQCVGTDLTDITLIPANATATLPAPSCPAGYRATSPYCWGGDAPGLYSTGSGLVNNSPTATAFCSWSNTTGTERMVYVGALCCRVPGR